MKKLYSIVAALSGIVGTGLVILIYSGFEDAFRKVDLSNEITPLVLAVAPSTKLTVLAIAGIGIISSILYLKSKDKKLNALAYIGLLFSITAAIGIFMIVPIYFLTVRRLSSS